MLETGAAEGETPPAINFFGPLSASTGLGVSARNWLRLLRAKGVRVHAVDVPDPKGRSGREGGFAPAYGPDEPAPHDVNVFAMNPWNLERFHAEGRRSVELGGRVNAMVPHWELPQLPAEWTPRMAAIDLVLAPTRFIADAFRRSHDAPEVVYVPHPLAIEEVAAADRARWGVPDEAFLAVTAFEPNNDVARKNPWAVIEAFGRAFPRDPRARLIVKLHNTRPGAAYAGELRRLRSTAAADPRIRILDAVLPYREVLALYACADVYVSLHCAEGLGLPLLESMTLGTPVVATGWSGNLDFMTTANSFLVDYELVPVCGTNHRAYRPEVLGPGARWARADVAQAADCLRRIAADPALARTRSERARRDAAARTRGADPAVFLSALRCALQARRARAPHLRARRRAREQELAATSDVFARPESPA